MVANKEWPPVWVGWHKPTRQACEEASTETMKRVMRPPCSCGADEQNNSNRGRFSIMHEYDCAKYKETEVEETSDVHRGRRIVDSSVRGGGTDEAKPDPTDILRQHSIYCRCVACRNRWRR